MGRGRTRRLRSRRLKTDKQSAKDKEAVVINLYKYLHSKGWKNETGLVCRDFEGTGRGLCSRKPQIDESLLIRLPFEALITLSTLEGDKNFVQLFPEEPAKNEMNFQALIAIYLLFLKHNPESEAKPYLDSIPKTFSNPCFCNRNEFYFFPTNLLLKTVEKSKIVRNFYSYFQTLLKGVECECCSIPYFPTIFTIKEFEWAMYAVNSRSVFLESREVKNNFFKKYLCDSPQLALAPFLDLFNHTDRPITSVNVATTGKGKQKSRFYELHTTEPYKPYQQIFISYGNQNNLKLLVEYGFLLQNNSSECFEIVLSDIEELIKTEKSMKTRVVHRKIFQFIRDHNLDDQMFFDTTEGMSHNLKVVLYLIFKETSHFPNILNQVAFGPDDSFDGTVDEEARLLLAHKINEYEVFQQGLQKIEDLTESGRAVLAYIDESLKYLQECSQAF